MSDRPIQLDASFDSRAHYTILVWLRPRDASVTMGEPVAVVVDGEQQRVISAPCSGRIVSVYADAGAHIMPRAIIGMIRPSIVLPDVIGGSRLGIVAGVIIALTVGMVTIANTASDAPLIQLPTFAANALVDQTPSATPADGQGAEERSAYPPPEEGAPLAPDQDPAALPTTVPDAALEPTVAPFATPDNALPMQPTPDPDPNGTGFDFAAERTQIINVSRQIAEEALLYRTFLAPGSTDANIRQSYVLPTLTMLEALQSDVNLGIDTAANVGTATDLMQELYGYSTGIGLCLEPYIQADQALSTGAALPDFAVAFGQCQNFLDSLPQDS
jgi:hypothetical protein